MHNAAVRILIVADAGDEAEQLLNQVRQCGFGVIAREACEAESLQALLQKQQWDLLLHIADCHGLSSVETLQYLAQARQFIPAIMLTRSPSACLDLPSYAELAGSDCAPGLFPHTVELSSLSTDAGSRQFQRRLETELMHLQLRRERRRASSALLELEQRHTTLLDTLSIPVACLQDGIHVYTNAAYRVFFGCVAEQELLHLPFLDLVVPDDVGKVRTYLQDSGHGPREPCLFEALTLQGVAVAGSLHSHSALLRSGQPQAQSAASDTRLRAGLQIMLTAADATFASSTGQAADSRDLQTGLANETYFHQALQHSINTAVYTAFDKNTASTLLVIRAAELENCGQPAQRHRLSLLVADAADALRSVLAQHGPADAVPARLSPAEFAVLLPGFTEHGNQMQSLLNHLEQALNMLGLQHQTGMAPVGADSETPHRLLAAARSLLQAETAPATGQLQRAQAASNAASAATPRQLIPFYQPLLSLFAENLAFYQVLPGLDRSGEIRAGLQFTENSQTKPGHAETAEKPEPLSRAELRELAGGFNPDDFLEREMLHQVLEQLRRDDSNSVYFLVNLTQNSLASQTLLPWLAQELHSRRLGGDRLILQLSEPDIINMPAQAVRFSESLQQLGISLSIDEFGACLDPISYLGRLCVHYVTLDASMIVAPDNHMAWADTDLLQPAILDAESHERLQHLTASLQARGVRVIAADVDDIEILPHLWQSRLNFVRGCCLHAPAVSPDFCFPQEVDLESC